FERESRPMKVDQAVNIEDLHRMAKRRLPKIMFDYIEGGVEDERGLSRNEAVFHRHRLLPRYLVDVSKRDQSATVFGQTFAHPFGISPTGGVGLYQRRGGELLLAEAAAEANIPYIMSGGSNASMEEAARIAPNNTWFQMYAAKDPAVTDALVGRARDNGLGALVLTVDVPVHPKRERNWRNGFANVRAGGVLEAAAKLKPSILIEALTHPNWVYDYVKDGGVRRGVDILIALCLGVQFCFFGRPTLYGAVAGGLPGVKKAIDIFRGEIDLVMGQIGCPSLSELGPDFLWRDDWPRNV